MHQAPVFPAGFFIFFFNAPNPASVDAVESAANGAVSETKHKRENHEKNTLRCLPTDPFDG